MPSKIEENRQKLLTGISTGALVPAEAPSPNPDLPPGMPNAGNAKNPNILPFLRSPIPNTMQLGTDSFQAFQKNTLPGVRVAPLPPSLTSAIGASGASQIIVKQQSGNIIKIEVNGNPVANQTLMNLVAGSGMSISSDAFGDITFSSSGGDGLTHSQPGVASGSWETDPAYNDLRDDFTHVQGTSSSSPPTTNIGQLGWSLFGSAGTHGGVNGGIFPYLGQFNWDNTGVQNQIAWLNLPNNGRFGGNSSNNWGWPIFDSPSFWMTWGFRLGGSAAGISGTVGAFGQKSMYIGFAGATFPANSNNTAAGRPDFFIGCRYDTSGYPGLAAGGSYSATAVTQSGSNMVLTGTFTGANQIAGTTWVGLWFTVSGSSNTNNNGSFICTAATPTSLTLTNPVGVTAGAQSITVKGATPMVLTAAANGTGTSVTYTGNIFSPVSNNFVGQQFFVSGFGNSGNNGGPWLCTANTTTTITLANPVPTGSAETHAGYAGGPVLMDNQLVLEVVQNPSYAAADGPNFTQGTTLATGVVPTLGVQTWHRLDVIGNQTGQVIVLLDGTSKLMATVNKQTITLGGGGLNGSVTANQLNVSWTQVNGTVANCPWASGSQVTVAGFTGGSSTWNGTFTCLATASPASMYFDFPTFTSTTSQSTSGSLVGYPAAFPTAIFGNDNNSAPSASTGMMWVDFFGFVWNPNLGPNAPGTPVVTKPRFW